jgi:cytoskeleton protein RodZ
MSEPPVSTLDDATVLKRPATVSRSTPIVAYLPVDTVGHDLCKARQRKGKELHDVSLVLKIRPEHLLAVEESRYDELPGRVYAIGYVRSYAAYLGLDAQTFVNRVKGEIGALPCANDIPLEPPPPARSLPAALRLPQRSSVIAGLLLLAMIYSGYHVFTSSAGTFEQPVTPVPPRLLAEARVVEQPVVVPLPAPVEQASALGPTELPPAPLPEVVATPAVALAAHLVPKVAAPLPPGRRYGVQNRTSRITLRVHRPTYVAVRGARNRAFIDRALFPGDTYRVPNVAGLRLSTEDAGAVELILDGSSVGFAGRDGAIARGLLLNPRTIAQQQG